MLQTAAALSGHLTKWNKIIISLQLKNIYFLRIALDIGLQMCYLIYVPMKSET